MIIDSHAHYSHRRFDQTFRCLTYEKGVYSIEESSREKLLSGLMKSGFKASVEPAIGIDSNEKVCQLALDHPGFIFPAYGCHPTRTFSAKWRDRKIIDKYAEGSDNCVAIGETGLDYHYKRREQHRLCQKRWFRYQIKLAGKLDKPLILHIRKAYADALKILKQHRKLLKGGVAHCFCEDVTVARSYVDLGFHIGIGGSLLTEEYGEVLSDVVRQIPLERIIVETDAPFVLPDTDAIGNTNKKYRIRNTSFVINAVIERIAEIKGIPVSAAERTIYTSTADLFALRSLLPGADEQDAGGL